MNKIPPYNTIDAKIAGDAAEILNAKVAIPAAIRSAVGSADSFALTVPPSAIVPGEDFCLKVSRIEKVDDQRLAYLANGDSYIFALVGEDVQEGDEYKFSILNEKVNVSVNDEEVLKAVEDEVSLIGRFSKTEVKENGDRVLHFFYNIGDYTVEAPKEQGYKINSIDGDSCYKKEYRYAVDRDQIHIAEEGEAGLDAKVLELQDYGNIRFAKIEADGQELLIKVDPDFAADKVKVAFDSKDVSVYSTTIDMKIC